MSYLVITLVFALVAGWNVVALRRATREAELMRSGYLPLALALRDAVWAQDTWRSQLNHVTSAENPAAIRRWFDATLATGRPQLFASVRAAVRAAFGPGQSAQQEMTARVLTELQEVEAFLAKDDEVLEELFAALEAGESSRALPLRDDLVRRGNEGRQRLVDLERGVTQNVESLLAYARTREGRAVGLLVASTVFTLFMGLAVAWRARQLLRPLTAVTRRAEAVAAGDLTSRPVVPSGDEIGQLATTFEAMVSAIARANAEVLAAERLAAIGKMAAQVTHEVRNPLSSLTLNLELLEEETSTEPQETQTLLRAIKVEVARLSRVAEKYLSLARSRPDLHEEDLSEIVRETLALAEPELRRHAVRVELELPHGLPAAMVDEGQMRQVLLNLVRNAQEAMLDGGELTISLEQVGESLKLSVADTGPGMDSATLTRVFEPFFTTKGHGTGLGLAITRELVEAHGGTIACEANRPRGARFVIELPITRGAGRSQAFAPD